MCFKVGKMHELDLFKLSVTYRAYADNYSFFFTYKERFASFPVAKLQLFDHMYIT